MIVHNTHTLLFPAITKSDYCKCIWQENDNVVYRLYSTPTTAKQFYHFYQLTDETEDIWLSTRENEYLNVDNSKFVHYTM